MCQQIIMSPSGPLWMILRYPATDTLQHKTLPIYSNRMARSKRCPIYTVVLSKGCEIGRNAELLQTLQSRNLIPQLIRPGSRNK